MDNLAAVLSALVAAFAALVIALIENRRLRRITDHARAQKKDEDLVAIRIREIDAVEEFRDTLRETIKEQGARITRLEAELEKHRLERLEHERERLEWGLQRRGFERRIHSLEVALKVAGVEIPPRESHSG